MRSRPVNGKRRHSGRRVLYRIIAAPAVGYPLLLCWQRGWLPTPGNNATALLRDGRLLQCQLTDRTQRTMYLGLFEPRETRLVKELLNPGDTFIDVGAHIGWFTTVGACRVGGAGRVLACEPYPPNAALLKRNLVQNDCNNVRLVEAALGSLPGIIALAKAGGDSGGVTALEWAWDGRVEVPITTLDEIADGLGSVALIKVDVEGWEAHVLRGAARTLLHTERVLIEINPAALKKAGSSPEEVFSLLQEAGFTKFLPIFEDGLRRLRRSTMSNALAMR
jgi:FkbM family methyltransferase